MRKRRPHRTSPPTRGGATPPRPPGTPLHHLRHHYPTRQICQRELLGRRVRRGIAHRPRLTPRNPGPRPQKPPEIKCASPESPARTPPRKQEIKCVSPELKKTGDKVCVPRTRPNSGDKVCVPRTPYDGGRRSNVQAYEWCSRIERDLAFAIIRVLKRIHGDDEWWVNGVPLGVRQKCVHRMEEEGCPLPKESYFELIDYREIARSNWGHFQQATPCQSKASALSWVAGINSIRNAVMHPAKRDITAEDIERLKKAHYETQKYLAKLEEI